MQGSKKSARLERADRPTRAWRSPFPHPCTTNWVNRRSRVHMAPGSVTHGGGPIQG